MGVADLVAAFNEAGEPKFTAQRAFLTYEPGDGIQWQRLTFHGTDEQGNNFKVRSNRLRPETDLNAASKAVARSLISAPAEPGVSP